MKYFALLISLGLSSFQFLFSQDASETANKFEFYLGAQTRVTPINLKKIPDYRFVTDRNVLEQPHTYLSGPSLIYGIGRGIHTDLEIIFSQSLRYDFIYETIPFNNQVVQGTRQKVYKSLITDLYLDMFRKWSSENSEIRLGVGVGIFGLGTSYILTERFVDNNNQSFYIGSKENFVFPAISATFGWRRKRLLAELKMGYCWNDPTMFDTPFLFPEIKVHYKLFSF